MAQLKSMYLTEAYTLTVAIVITFSDIKLYFRLSHMIFISEQEERRSVLLAVHGKSPLQSLGSRSGGYELIEQVINTNN